MAQLKSSHSLIQRLLRLIPLSTPNLLPAWTEMKILVKTSRWREINSTLLKTHLYLNSELILKLHKLPQLVVKDLDLGLSMILKDTALWRRLLSSILKLLKLTLLSTLKKSQSPLETQTGLHTAWKATDLKKSNPSLTLKLPKLTLHFTTKNIEERSYISIIKEVFK